MQAFLNEQFAAPISTYPAPASTDDMTVVQKRFFTNALTGQDQLRQRVAFALSQIMVASADKGEQSQRFRVVGQHVPERRLRQFLHPAE